MRRLRNAFTMLELVFVIVVMGIVGTIGVEIFRTTYDAYMSSVINHRLQSDTELTLEQIVNRLQYRFKDSVIGRDSFGGFDGLTSSTVNQNYMAIEWVGYDIDGWLGDEISTMPTWSGFIDVNNIGAGPNLLITPGTDTARVNTIIASLRATGSTTNISNAAIFFTGANTNIQTGYGWNGVILNNQINSAAHRVNAGGVPGTLQSGIAGIDFTGVDIYEQYKLAWTAYALAVEGRQLFLYYDYQPWEGESYDGVNVANRKRLLMDNVTTFKFQAIGDIVKIQLCVDNNDAGNLPANQIYSLCKEKVIF